MVTVGSVREDGESGVLGITGSILSGRSREKSNGSHMGSGSTSKRTTGTWLAVAVVERNDDGHLKMFNDRTVEGGKYKNIPRRCKSVRWTSQDLFATSGGNYCKKGTVSLFAFVSSPRFPSAAHPWRPLQSRCLASSLLWRC